MATADKLNKLLETKAAIRQAIIDKGVEVGEDTVFADYSNKIAEISGGSDDFLALRTSNHTNYNSLFAFYEGESIESFGIDTWDTSNVINMSGMFQHCGSLTELDLSNFNTGNVRDISAIFVYCISLETLDIRNFDLTRAFSYSYMIVECPKLHTLRLDNCSNDTISKIIESDGFPTGTIEGVQSKIYVNPDNIGDLTAPDGWVFVDSDGNEIVQGIPLYQPGEFKSNSEITEVTTMVNESHTDLSNMFSGCINLTTINGIEDWDTSNVTTMMRMFSSCYLLTSLDLSNWNTSNVTHMGAMFNQCYELQSLDLSNWDTSSVTEIRYMFCDCASLHTLRLDNCSNDTINKIITSSYFPTKTIEGVTRKIYCKEANAAGLTAPTNWIFEYVD